MSFPKQANSNVQRVIPTRSTYNALVWASQRHGGMSSGDLEKYKTAKSIEVFNAGVYDIPMWGAVAFDNSVVKDFSSVFFENGVIPAYSYFELNSDVVKDCVWGIAVEPIFAGKTGSVLINGVLCMNLGGSFTPGSAVVNKYIEPYDSMHYQFASSGSCRVMEIQKNGYVVVLLNAGSGGASPAPVPVSAYDGPFALSIASGYITVAAGTVLAGTVLVPVSSETFDASTSPGEVMYFTMRLFYSSVDSYYADIYEYNNLADAHSQGTGYEDWCYVVILGTYDVDSGKLTQWQHGDIFVAGRLV